MRGEGDRVGASVSLPLVFFLLREFFSERLEQAIVQANSNSGQGHVLHSITSLAFQHLISDWLGKLKPNKFSTGCHNDFTALASSSFIYNLRSGLPFKK